MSQIRPSHLIISISFAIALVGCGNKNDKAAFSSDGGHSSNWVSIHKVSARANAESCIECHGDNYDGGISKVSCTSAEPISGFACHATSPVANSTGCISCHGDSPSGPFGSTAPNRMFAHNKHTALTDCASCHLNTGADTANHAKISVNGGKATVALLSSFSIDTASRAAYDVSSGKCANVSCHGGLPTPAWASQTNLVAAGNNALCMQCHEFRETATTPRYNNYYSGHHQFHLGKNVNAKCTDCHNIAKLTNFQFHFSGIATRTTSSPRLTVGQGAPTKIDSYSAAATCTTACHPNTVNIPWVQTP